MLYLGISRFNIPQNINVDTGSLGDIFGHIFLNGTLTADRYLTATGRNRSIDNSNC